MGPLITLTVCALILSILGSYFRYRYFYRGFDRDPEPPRRRKHSKRKPSSSVLNEAVDISGTDFEALTTTQTSKTMNGGSTTGLPPQLTQMLEGIMGSSIGWSMDENSSITVSTTTTNGQSFYQVTDDQGKVHGYTSLEELPPEMQALFEGQMGNLGSFMPGAPATIPHQTPEEVLAQTTVPVKTDHSQPEARSKPASATSTGKADKKRKPNKLAYIPLEPEIPGEDDEGGDS